MRIGVISDVHGNIRALDNCLAFLREQKPDHQIFLGDAIGYLPYGIEVLERLRTGGFECIKGNHEAMLLGILPIPEKNEDVYKLGLIKKKISDDMKEFIQSWKDFLMIETGGKKYFFVHGSPIDRLKGYIYPDTDLSPFSDVEWDVIVMGHTHYPFLREEYHKIFINAGSVGLPRDAGNLSSLVLIDTDPLHIHHYRLRFDAEKILSEIKKENLHEATVERLRRGNDIPAFGMEVKN